MANPSPQEIINAASRLTATEQAAIVDALLHNAMTADHGPEDDATTVQESWHNEVSRRVKDIAMGQVKTIPATEAERMIREGDRPTF